MAQRAIRPHDVIPLSRWLREQGAPVTAPPPAMAGDDLPPAEGLPCSGQCEAMEGLREQHRAREEELGAALAAAEERAAELSAALVRREEELKAGVADELARRIEVEIGEAFEALLRRLEDALAEVLTPFLTHAAREKAMAELKELLSRALREADEPVLALRAPLEFHDRLEVLRPQLAVSAALGESAIIEIVFAGHRLRFEDLSSRWCAAIRGEEEP